MDEIERKIRAMQADGISNGNIAKTLGIPHKQVLAATGVNDYFRRPNCAYPGIQKWLIDNHIGRFRFFSMLWDNGCTYSEPTLRQFFAGKNNPKKDLIEDVLQLTGLTYEEAFHGTYV